jgi:hypothetical protein
MGENPDEMIYLHNKGWSSTSAHFAEFKASEQPSVTLEGSRQVRWTRFDIPILIWSHTAHLLILQGMPLQRFFYDCFLESGADKTLGPFVYLGGTMTPPYEPPGRLLDVVLAQLHDPPPATYMEIFAALVEQVHLA